MSFASPGPSLFSLSSPESYFLIFIAAYSNAMDKDIASRFMKPGKALAGYVDSFWMVENLSDEYKDIVIVPDGRVDLFFSYSGTEPYHVTLMGIESEPTQTKFPPKTVIYAVSFKLQGVEYILQTRIADIVDKGRFLPDDFWGITKDDINDFDHFCRKVTAKMEGLLPTNIDDRKQRLFDLIYSSSGSLTVKEISEKVYWSSRQINRYFTEWYGISLKAYCTILRFRASFQHIAEGKLFPEQNFADQAHFIKEVKKLSGVNPKELFKNPNDRFLQFSALKRD